MRPAARDDCRLARAHADRRARSTNPLRARPFSAASSRPPSAGGTSWTRASVPASKSEIGRPTDAPTHADGSRSLDGARRGIRGGSDVDVPWARSSGARGCRRIAPGFRFLSKNNLSNNLPAPQAIFFRDCAIFRSLQAKMHRTSL